MLDKPVQDKTDQLLHKLHTWQINIEGQYLR